MRKGPVLWIIALLILSIGGMGFADSMQPRIGIISDGGIQTLTAGEKMTYEMTLYNSSSLMAHNITVSIDGDHPFTTDPNSLWKQVSGLSGHQSTTVSFDVTVSPMAEQKTYEFEVTFDYNNSDGTTYTSTSKAYVKVRSNNVEPIVGVVSYRSGYDSITPGVKDGIVLNLKNGGTLDATDVRVTLSGFENTGVMLDSDVSTKSIATIRAGATEMVSYNVKAGSNATTGVKEITAKIVYIDTFGNSYEKTETLYFDVDGIDTDGLDIEIKDVSYPTTVKASQQFNVAFTVTNKSALDIASAEIAVEYPSDFVAITPAKKVVRNLKAGASETVNVTLMAKSSLSSQNYDGWITVKYYASGDSSDNAETISNYLGFFVEDASAGSKPKLIIDHYEYGGETVLAGENYTLSLFIKNTSSSESTRNIKVTLTGEDNVFTPVDSSSSFFISGIQPGAVYEHNIDLKTKIDASVKIYKMTVKMEYEDGEGNAYDSTDTPYAETEDLSIAVAQPVRLETADIVVPYEIYVGQPFYIEQEFYNMGKATMYNMMVKLEGVESSEASYFVGNFDAGSSDYYSAQANPYEEGTFEGKLTYSFEDALGNVSTQEVPFTYTVMPAMEFDDGGFPTDGGMMPEEEPQSGGLSKLVIGGIIVVAAVAAGIVFRKRRKAKLQRALEDLDE